MVDTYVLGSEVVTYQLQAVAKSWPCMSARAQKELAGNSQQLSRSQHGWPLNEAAPNTALKLICTQPNS